MNEESIVILINQIHELEKKLCSNGVEDKFQRNLKKIRDQFKGLGYIYQNPKGEKYDIMRTDCEANILESANEPYKVSEVLKPIIYRNGKDSPELVQKGVVIIE